METRKRLSISKANQSSATDFADVFIDEMEFDEHNTSPELQKDKRPALRVPAPSVSDLPVRLYCFLFLIYVQ